MLVKRFQLADVTEKHAGAFKQVEHTFNLLNTAQIEVNTSLACRRHKR